MKVEIKEKETKKENLYPKVRINDDGLIVLFLNPKMGTILNNVSTYYGIGYPSSNFNDIDFTDFEGSITLSND